MVNSPDYQVVNISPEKLHQDLLVELHGDQSDIKSKAWYHGSISRQHAEKIISRNGDFLVRDCISHPGDFVLTCFWKGGPLHFVINSTVKEQAGNHLPKVTYHFEELQFNSVQDLIQFYMDECKPITDISGAVITTPIARTMPLSYYDSKYGALAANPNASAGHYSLLPNSQAHLNRSPRSSPLSSPQRTPGGSPRGSPGSVRRVERSGSQPLLSINDVPVNIPMDRSDSLPLITGLTQQYAAPSQNFSSTLPRYDTGIYKQVTPVSPQTYSGTPPTHLTSPPSYFHQRSGSAPVVMTPGLTITQHLTPPANLNPASSEGDLHNAPPPKPSRIPSVKYKQKPVVQIRNKALYDDDDRDYSDYSQVKEEPSWVKHNGENNNSSSEVISSNQYLCHNNKGKLHSSRSFTNNHDLNQNISKSDSRKISDTRYAVLDGHDYADIPAFPLQLDLSRKPTNIHQNDEKSRVKIPEIKTEASFDLSEYSSFLLPDENKLLEPAVLLKMRQVLLNTSPKDLAGYLTKEDLEILKVLNTDDIGVFVISGLELITLPQGKQLRQDVLERYKY